MNDSYSYSVVLTAVAASFSIAAFFLWKYETLKAERVTEEDIMTMVNEGHEQGLLEQSEAEMITNIFELNDKVAEDIMTNRMHLVALPGDMSVGDAAAFVLKEGNNSRYPVYEKDLDNIIGTLHIRDIFVFADNPEHKSIELSKVPGLLREPRFIPENRSIGTIFKEMQSQKIHMEIVIDEYGQTVGLVTMEDILEEIVGNILDEYDEDEEFIVSLADELWLVQGMTPLSQVEDALLIKFSEKERDIYDTINGLLISHLGRIPVEGEHPTIKYLGYVFEILQMDHKRIDSVRVRPLEKEHIPAVTGYLESTNSLEF